MIIIKRKTDNVVTWAFDCNVDDIDIQDNRTVAPDIIILDMTASTADKVEVASIPADFEGGKYKYVNNQFELNSDYS